QKPDLGFSTTVWVYIFSTSETLLVKRRPGFERAPSYGLGPLRCEVAAPVPNGQVLPVFDLDSDLPEGTVPNIIRRLVAQDVHLPQVLVDLGECFLKTLPASRVIGTAPGL